MSLEQRVVPSRFAGGVPSTDAGLRTLDGAGALGLELPPHSRDAATPGDKRASIPSAHLVFYHDLYPIIPHVDIGPLPPTIWCGAGNGAWRDGLFDAWHAAGYERDPTTTADYYAMIESPGGAPALFGAHVNPIRSVVRRAVAIDCMPMLTHHVLAVALQYWLIARGAFMRRRTDAAVSFNENMTPFVFLMFRSLDWAVNKSTLADIGALGDLGRLEAAARASTFPVFLYQVLVHVFAEHSACLARRWLPESLPGAAQRFCIEKLRKNFVQTLTCMRFREVLPRNIVERLHEARPRNASDTRLGLIKFFAHPKACRMLRLETRAPRMPQVFTHLFFAPDEPLVVDDTRAGVTSTERQQHLMWFLLLFFPLSTFKQTVGIRAKEAWTEAAAARTGPAATSPANLVTFPTTPFAKFREYDAFVPLNPVRARYAMYFRDNQAFAYVPNLLLPIRPGLLPHNEADPRFMSAQAWRWCVAAGARTHAVETLGAVVKAAAGGDRVMRFAAACVVGLAPTRANAFPFLWALTTLLRSEEAAVYALVTERAWSACNTLADVCASYAAHAAVATPHIALDADVAALHDAWDRCTPLSSRAVRSAATRGVWYFAFPPAVITFGGAPWVQRWRTAASMPHCRAVLQALAAKCSHAEVLDELRRARDVEPSVREKLVFLAALLPDDSEAARIITTAYAPGTPTSE